MRQWPERISASGGNSPQIFRLQSHIAQFFASRQTPVLRKRDESAHVRRKMRREQEVFGSGDRAFQSSLEEALKRIIRMLAREAVCEASTQLPMEPAGGSYESTLLIHGQLYDFEELATG